MSTAHGKDLAVSLGGHDLSPFGTTVEWARTSDSHDVTTFGKDAHVYRGGLQDGTATLNGFYDTDDTDGPSAVIEEGIGTVMELVYRPEGAGTGLPEKTVDVLVTGYTESVPVNDMVTFTASLQMSDTVALTVQ